MQLVSWNVNGVRAILKKDFLKSVAAMAPDVICFQETKAGEDESAEALAELGKKYVYVNSSKARKGYSGTAIVSSIEPVNVTYDIGVEALDREGRVITAEFMNFFLLTVYTPNSGEGLARLEHRTKWDEAFRFYVSWLRKRKPVIVCGDLNVAHQPIDLTRAKENYNKSAGYTQQEIDGFKRLLDEGMLDSFRHLYPETAKYTYWDYVTSAREKNIGWRIDYFLVDHRMMPAVKDASIYNEHFGSDHCPVGLTLTV